MIKRYDKPPGFIWPHGARVVVMPTVMFETWPRDKTPPAGSMGSRLRDGTIDLHGLSWAEYGGRTGIWRLLDIFEKAGVKSTVCANAHAAEHYPEAMQAFHKAGHEIAGHSYTQDMLLPYMKPDDERALIGRCLDIIADVTGARPAGWASPRLSPSEHTAGFLAEQGLIWHGDYNDTDLPYVIETAHGRIAALMHSDFTDNRAMRSTPRAYLEAYADTFDFLIASGQPEIINLTVHAHFGGRPPIAAMVSRALAHMAALPGVWFARHDEVARWVLDFEGMA